MIKDKAVTFCGHEFECVDTGFGEQMQVDVVIRPEDIYIFDVSDAAQLTGTVTSCIFKGVHYEMLVQTREGYELMVQDYHCFEAGREVGLLVKPFDIHVMKKERTCTPSKANFWTKPMWNSWDAALSAVRCTTSVRKHP